MSTTNWKLLYFGGVLKCDSPILEGLFHGRPEDNPLDLVEEVFKKHNVPFGKISPNSVLNVCYGSQRQFIIYQGAKCMGTFEIIWERQWHFTAAYPGCYGNYQHRGNWFRLLEDALTIKPPSSPRWMQAFY